MFLFTYEKRRWNGKIEAECLSTDVKPVNSPDSFLVIFNGSTCLEMDTGHLYIFDKENNRWLLLGGGSGGGASIDSDGFVVADGTTIDEFGVVHFGVPTSMDEDGNVIF